MNTTQAIQQLKALSNTKRRQYNIRNGIGDNQYGVPMGDIRKLAKQIKSDHKLGLELWKINNFDVRLLATLLLKPKELTSGQVNQMLEDSRYSALTDWLVNQVVKKHKDKETLRLKWLTSSKPLIARAGWNLTTERISKKPEGLDLVSLLDTIEQEMAAAVEESKWYMNFALAEIGIHFEEHRQRAINIGETIGAYIDFPTSKGCTSPYAPTWINSMVERQD